MAMKIQRGTPPHEKHLSIVDYHGRVMLVTKSQELHNVKIVAKHVLICPGVELKLRDSTMTVTGNTVAGGALDLVNARVLTTQIYPTSRISEAKLNEYLAPLYFTKEQYTELGFKPVESKTGCIVC